MLGARNIQSMKNANVYIHFIDPTSEKEVGDWTYWGGASIKK